MLLSTPSGVGLLVQLVGFLLYLLGVPGFWHATPYPVPPARRGIDSLFTAAY